MGEKEREREKKERRTNEREKERERRVNVLPRNGCNQKKIARLVLHIIYKPRWSLMLVFSGRRGN